MSSGRGLAEFFELTFPVFLTYFVQLLHSTAKLTESYSGGATLSCWIRQVRPPGPDFHCVTLCNTTIINCAGTAERLSTTMQSSDFDCCQLMFVVFVSAPMRSNTCRPICSINLHSLERSGQMANFYFWMNDAHFLAAIVVFCCEFSFYVRHFLVFLFSESLRLQANFRVAYLGFRY